MSPQQEKGQPSQPIPAPRITFSLELKVVHKSTNQTHGKSIICNIFSNTQNNGFYCSDGHKVLRLNVLQISRSNQKVEGKLFRRHLEFSLLLTSFKYN